MGALLVGVAAARADDATATDDDAPAGIDWSVALRGAYAVDNGGAHPEAIIAPDLSLRLPGGRGDTTLGAGGAATITPDGTSRISDLHSSVQSSYQLDEVSSLRGTLNLSVTQLDPDDPSLPLDTTSAPLTFMGTGEGDASRRFGLFDVTGRLKGERFVEGPTTISGGSTIDNAPTNYWQGEVGLRTGYELGPLVSLFVDGSEGYQKFDAPDPTLLKFLDARTTELRGGISYNDDGMLSAELSAGRAWIDYVDPAVTDVPAWVADASVTFNPSETWSLDGSLETTLGPSTSIAGDTDAGYTLSGDARYRVNPWLTLRSSASLDRVITLGTSTAATSYALGAGLDFASSRHAVWSADYSFAHDDDPPNPAENVQTITIGLKIRR